MPYTVFARLRGKITYTVNVPNEADLDTVRTKILQVAGNPADPTTGNAVAPGRIRLIIDGLHLDE